MALICDTGALYSAIDRDDPAHSRCAALFATTRESRLVPAPVVVELEWLVTSRMGYRPFDAFLASIEEASVIVEELDAADYARIRELCRHYDSLPLGLVDASVVAIAERLGERVIATLDHRHFGTVRPRHVQAFTLLPE